MLKGATSESLLGMASMASLNFLRARYGFVPRTQDSGERIRANQRLAKQKYGSLYDEVLRILAKHDPIDIAELPDEYDPEVRTILPRLEHARSALDARRIIHEEFVQWFSKGLAGPEENFERVSAEVWEAWNRFRARRSSVGSRRSKRTSGRS